MALDEIKNCRYISSVGMLKNLDDMNMITYGDGHVGPMHRVTHDFEKLLEGRDGICIYIKFEYIRHFFENAFPKIDYKFILVTGDGDDTLPYELLSEHTFNQIISDERIIHWYSVNCIEDAHPKLSIIPIGVNFHSASFDLNFSGWHDRLLSPLEQEAEIQQIKDSSLPFHERKMMCYSNFHFATYPKFGDPRKDAISRINKEIAYYEPTLIPRIETWQRQSEYAFVLSPMGNGMDCHRTWESLILGCIPVVKKSPIDVLYDGLPVLIVDEWEQLTPEFLFKTSQKFKSMDFDLERITAEYWLKKIRSTK